MSVKIPEKAKDKTYLLAKKAALAAISKKADDVIILSLRELTSVADFFVICTGDVDVHVRAIADEVKKALKHDLKPWHVEGYLYSHWVLIDFVDFVVHVFQKETRDYYNIERLWADAPQERIAQLEEILPEIKN